MLTVGREELPVEFGRLATLEEAPLGTGFGAFLDVGLDAPDDLRTMLDIGFGDFVALQTRLDAGLTELPVATLDTTTVAGVLRFGEVLRLVAELTAPEAEALPLEAPADPLGVTGSTKVLDVTDAAEEVVGSTPKVGSVVGNAVGN